MKNSEVYRKLVADSKLPSPSKVAAEVIRLCYSETSSLQDIANVVETDPALSAKFLKYANSVLMGSHVPITSVQRAAVRIGIRGMASMALSFSLISQQMACECREFNYRHYWSKSLAHAVAARALAQNDKKFDQDELFTCALLSHIGELALATAFPDEYAEILAHSPNRKALLAEEQRVFELDHHTLSAEMLLSWGLPKEFAQAVQTHESYVADEEEDEKLSDLTEILYLALQIAHICMLDIPLAISFDTVEKLAENHGVAAKTFGEFLEQVVLDWQEWGDLFHIQTQQCPLYHQLKALDAKAIETQVRTRSKTDILLLAVDDDPLTLLNLSRILANDSRQIITADNGRQALYMALKQRPEMIITDWRMPHMDGLELCKALRRETATQHTYIIMLTGAEADDELVQAFDAGADDYVVKPFTPKVLEARIRGGERMIRYQRKINSDREVIQKYAARLGIANRKLHTMAMTDALTGLPNRRNAMDRLKDVVAESSRHGDKLSCIMIDIDHFKTVNDTYGHDNGDIVLKEVTRIFIKNARSYDMVSRMGGEEFLVISTRSNPEESFQLAERLREAVEKHSIALDNGSVAQVTISAGVASWNDQYADGGELIKAADNALYLAKKNGRNRVEVALAG